MDLAVIEQQLRASAGVILVEPRLVRRVIKHHRHVSGLVPHGRCYAIDREQLLALVDVRELGLRAAEVPAEPVLVARPSHREMRHRPWEQVIEHIWRAAFHAKVHGQVEPRLAQADDRSLRQRIEQIGVTEFDEIRATLRHDDTLLPPYGDREVYVEFAATYLELRHFAPALLTMTFPVLEDLARIDRLLANDVDASALLAQGPMHGPAASLQRLSLLVPVDEPAPEVSACSTAQHARLMRAAHSAAEQANHVRAAILCERATGVQVPSLRDQAAAAAEQALRHLADRLDAALGIEVVSASDWVAALQPLARRAASDRHRVRFGPEAKVLDGLQQAARAFERPHQAVDVASFFLSLGRRGMIRQLDATRELRVARILEATAKKVRHVRLSAAERRAIRALLDRAWDQAERNVRLALRPRLVQVLDEVGLRPRHGSEALARDKLVEELIDGVVANGYLTFGQLRDALSRNQLKLADLQAARELWSGDTLIRADAKLAIVLDGIYRRSDIYLRGLQKLSSVPFGTRTGRWLTLYVVLPLGGAFVLLEGVRHVIGPLLELAGAGSIGPASVSALMVTAAAIFGLLHSEPLRALAWQVLEVVGVILAWVFFRIPRAILTQPSVIRWLSRPSVRAAMRRVVVPMVVAATLFGGVFAAGVDVYLSLAAGLASFAVLAAMMSTTLGERLEDFFIEQLAPTWQVLSRQWLPELFRLVVRAFSALMDLLQQGMYRVDELLRFHQGNTGVLVFGKALVGLGWALVAYVVRLYITLLVEPEVNPLKHFPVVTVAHKLLLPFLPQLMRIIEPPLMILGPIVGGAIAGLTVFLLPSVFGFLTWEFKENFKLYQATRPKLLGASRVGPHGETLRGLLVPGLHSGTLPKMHDRLRRQAQRRLSPHVRSEADARGWFHEAMRDIEQGLKRFVDRDLLQLVQRCPSWQLGVLRVVRIDLSSHRIRVQLACEAGGGHGFELTFEQHAGLVVAGISGAGFLELLRSTPGPGELLFENALAGLYQRAEVDVVREQIEAELGPVAHYDFEDEGLVVWPAGQEQTELVYALDRAQAGMIVAQVRGASPQMPPRVLDARRAIFKSQRIATSAWESAWLISERGVAFPPRLVLGSSLLPSRCREAALPEVTLAPAEVRGSGVVSVGRG